MPRRQRPDETEAAFEKAVRDRVLNSILTRFDAKKPSAETRPEGIVTVVFTDIEDSSVLVSTLGNERARALIRTHDDMLRETVHAHDGTEVERAGDGFMVAFSTATRSVEWAIDLQRRLGEQAELTEAGIRVRIGMETGEVISDDKGYFGKTVFAASRICDLARGGQIMVSEATYLIAGPDRFGFQDLGEHDLKGLAGPHHLYQVTWSEPEGAGSGS